MPERGETLSEAQLGQLKPVRGEGGRSRRAMCPFHGSDKQRSLRVEQESGRFQCFACGVWGYMDWAREDFARAKTKPIRPPAPRRAPVVPPPPGLESILAAYQAALPGSPGAEYLEERGIPLALAQSVGVGYAAPGQWAHRNEANRSIRDYSWGRLVFPHTAPSGLVNLYGRALGERAPKSLRHDHLPGAKGYFHFPSLTQAAAQREAVYVCEGPFDALSLMAARPGCLAMAIFGVNGWRHDWASGVADFVFALDADAAGQRAWQQLARQLVLRGKTVRYLSAESYGGAKDANEAWMAGTLDLG